MRGEPRRPGATPACRVVTGTDAEDHVERNAGRGKVVNRERMLSILLALAIPVLCAPSSAEPADEGTVVASAEARGEDLERQMISRDDLRPRPGQVLALRLGGPVRLDGRLDEPAWQGPSAAPLHQNDPDNGAPPRQRTDWWIAYDAEALYVAARLHDTAPESISARLGRRDTWPQSDWVYLNLDTYNDDRNAFSFSVNPAGTIGDAVLYNDGWDDPSWDGIWDCATAVDDDGWSLEMRIPFSQLSFPDRPQQVWGINFSRRILRYQERDELFHRPREESGYMRRFPDLVGIEGINAGHRLEVLAYGAARAARTEVDAADPFHDGSDIAGNAGLDLSLGLSSSLRLNATVNPDFGQVEVDPAVVNLSDFETFFEEKRPFFVRDANTFRFGREGTNSNWSFNWMDPMPFYSRRIGRQPQVSSPDNEFADLPGETTILGAAKLSGKVDGFDVGAVAAATDEERARLELDGLTWTQPVEPRTAYGALRLRRASGDGRRGVGLMSTHVERRLDDPRGRAELPGGAHVVGLDGWTNLDDGRVWAVKAYASASRVSGEADAIDALQRSPVRYLQRPGRTGLAYDPERTSLIGWAGRAMLNKESGNLTLNTAVGAVSPGYEINDLGFQFRADQLNWHLAAGYRWLEPTRTFRYRGFNLATYRSWDYGGHPDAYGYGLFWDLTFTNYWQAGGMVFYNPDRYSLRATRGGPAMRLPDHAEGSLYVSSDSRRALIVGAQGSVSHVGDGSQSASGSLEITLRPRAALRITVSPALQWLHDRTMWVDNVEDPAMVATAGVRHLFGDLDYREFSMATRVDWTFTPRLSLQSYVQPLIAAGRYTGLKEFARPHSYEFNLYGEGGSTIDYDAGDEQYLIDPDGVGPAPAFALDDPDFSYKSLRVNMVLRWEYRPGSTIFLVWTQDRLNYDNPGDFRLGRDARSLLDAPGDDIFMVKVTSWLDL